VGESVFNAVFKNGYDRHKADIFVQGIVPMVGSSIVIETFGSPKPWEPDCKDAHTVGNTQEIVLSEGIRWGQWYDHSKWVYAVDNDYVCFGDLNRNTEKQL
jgi:hypothetical protein